MQAYTLRQFKAARDHHAKRGQPAIPAGTQLYAIRLPRGGFFTWSYINRGYAERIADRLRFDRNFAIDFNRVAKVEYTIPSGRAAD